MCAQPCRAGQAIRYAFCLIRAVCVNGAVFGIKQLGENLAVMHVACNKVSGFDEAVFVNVDVNFETISAGFLAIGSDFNIPLGFWILGAVAVTSFIGASAPSFNHAGIDNGDATVFDEQTFLMQLKICFFKQGLSDISLVTFGCAVSMLFLVPRAPYWDCEILLDSRSCAKVS